MTIEVRWGAATDVGRRAVNQDALLAEPPLFVVADGMGGHAAGEVASGLAVERLRRFAGSSAVDQSSVIAAIRGANDDILRHASAERHGMGTTIAGIALTRDDAEDAVLAFNVGDSRVYRLADRLTQISADHSEVAELLERGDITPEEARTHARRNVVTRALGLETELKVDSWLLPAGPGEVFVICSDGVTGDVTDVQIAGLVVGCADPQEAAERLVALALASGARDNLTAVVVVIDHVQPGVVVDEDDTDPRVLSENLDGGVLIAVVPAGPTLVKEPADLPSPLITAVPPATETRLDA